MQKQAQKRQVKGTTIEQLFGDLSQDGAVIASIDTLVVVKLNKTIAGKGTGANPHYGRVLKRTENGGIMLFSNTNSNGYQNMVQKRLAKEGKVAANFQLAPLKWGTRRPNSPIIDHNGKTYLQVIYLRKPTLTEYLLDGKPIAKEDIIGLTESEPAEESQGGLDDKVIVRTYEWNSIKRIRTDNVEYLM